MSNYPLSMSEGAIAMHEFYLSLIEAGFTENQALQLVLGMATGKPNEG